MSLTQLEAAEVAGPVRQAPEWLELEKKSPTSSFDSAPFGMRVAPAPDPGQTPLSVLLAEDDDDLRLIMQILLEQLGYVVVPCEDAHLASQAFQTHIDFSLLLTDIEMPGRSGVELARELTALRPSLAVMIVSGSMISAEVNREMRSRNWGFLSKPFHIPDLVAALQRVMRQSQQLHA